MMILVPRELHLGKTIIRFKDSVFYIDTFAHQSARYERVHYTDTKARLTSLCINNT